MTIMRWLHKWLGLIVGLQMTLWMLSGFMMAAFSMHQVKGGDRISNAAPAPLSRQLQPVSAIRDSLDGAVSVVLRHGPDAAIYHVTGPDASFLLDAQTGAPYAITEERAITAARHDYAGPGRPVSAGLLTAPFLELRKHTGDVWRVEFDDGRKTTLYVDAVTGQILERRNDIWRVFDVFWMLHTMDYVGRDNFNNPLVIVAGLAALWLAMSGFILLFSSFRKRDFDLLAVIRRARGNTVTCTVRAPGSEARSLSISPGLSYFDALASAGINLPSNCGGAGSCGQCTLRLLPAEAATKADREHLTETELQNGYRLACQHWVDTAVEVELPQGVLDNHPLTGQVSATRFIAPFVKEVRIRLDTPLERPFVAGQYVQLTIPRGAVDVSKNGLPPSWHERWSTIPDPLRSSSTEEVSRIYSIAIAPHENAREVVLNVRLVPPSNEGSEWGRGSAFVFSLSAGDEVTLAGPFGRFGPSSQAASLVLIGGGSGMAPLRSIVRHEYSEHGQKRPVRFFYGARSEADILYREEFEALHASNDAFEWISALSGDDAYPSPDWEGHEGFIHEIAADMLSANPDHLANTEFLLCGPPALIAAARSTLLALGIEAHQILVEDFGI